MNIENLMFQDKILGRNFKNDLKIYKINIQAVDML